MSRIVAAALAAIMFALFISAGHGIARAEQTAAQPAAAVDARLAGDTERTRLIVDINRVVSFNIFPLADPYRLIIDLPEVDFRLPPGSGEEGRGLVSAYRYGSMGRGRSRIVLDLNDPGTVDKAFMLEPVDDQPARLVIDIVTSSRESYLAAVADAAREMSVARAAAPPPPAPTPKPNGKPIVVIDPGHGGIDPGAVSGSYREKDIVFTVARIIAERIEKQGKYRPVLTREDDIFIPLGERVEFAREHNAALMISIHADALNVAQVSGATVYTLSESASDALSAKLAEQENRSDVIAGVDLSDEPDEVAGILIDLVRRETKNLSITLARQMVEDVSKATKMNKNPLRSAGFWVLKAPEVPSILLELGYMTNASDVRRMTDPKWQSRMADAVTQSITTYLEATKGDLASN